MIEDVTDVLYKLLLVLAILLAMLVIAHVACESGYCNLVPNLLRP
jgi:hypothetical protein